MIAVQSQYCPQNHRCPTLRVCPTGALQQQGYGAPTIDSETCIECGKCVATCRVFKEVASISGGSEPLSHRSPSFRLGGVVDKLTRRSEG